jgi:DNA-binding NarL/FixJ family response regulator
MNKVMKQLPLIPSFGGKVISVIIADDRALFRRWLQKLFKSTRDIRVVGSVENGVKAVNLSMVLQPEVVVMDVSMPLLNGLAAARRIFEFSPDIRVLMLSAHGDTEYMEEAMRCGASGYVVKHSSPALVIDAVREARKGGPYFAPPITGTLKRRCVRLFAEANLLRRTGSAAEKNAAPGG